MEQLIQNPGRPSQGGDTSASAANMKNQDASANSSKNKGSNIFASKVRRATQPANPPRITYNDENNMVSSGAEDADGQSSHGDEDDYENDNDETQSEKEWNLKEEITFEKICLTLLSE